MANVVILRGAFITTKRITADNSPARSAIPTPSKATSTVPKGANPVKLVTILARIRRIPSASSKLII